MDVNIYEDTSFDVMSPQYLISVCSKLEKFTCNSFLIFPEKKWTWGLQWKKLQFLTIIVNVVKRSKKRYKNTPERKGWCDVCNSSEDNEQDHTDLQRKQVQKLPMRPCNKKIKQSCGHFLSIKC